MLINLASALGLLLLVGALYGAAGVWVRARFGHRAVLALWLGMSAATAALGTARSAAAERGFRYQPARQHPAWMFALFAALLLLVLAPPTAALSRGEPERAPGAWALRAAVLVLPGLALALVVGVALDLGGVDFLPPR